MVRLQQHKHILGSEAYITLIGNAGQFLEMALEMLWQELTIFEHTFSRFLSDSELTYVNERAGLPTEVSTEFIALACTAQDYVKRTDGLYNPFVLPALQRAGYKGSWPHMDTQGEAPDFSERNFSKSLRLKIDGSNVTIPDHSALDFGGIGKGYALDQLGAILRRQGIENYWVSLGGDILASGTDIDGKSWQIPIGQALDEAITCAQLPVGPEPQAVATSGIVKRAGTGWNHLIDPRTGHSTKTDILAASVVADSGVSADVYAKRLVLMGSREAPKFAKKLGILDYVLQIQSKQGTVVVSKQGDFQ